MTMSEEAEVGSITKHFGKVKDPRIERSKRHKLIDIILIAICGVICGADSWVDIEMFGKAKLDWPENLSQITEWHTLT
jgi:hypothetical protein